MIEDQVTPKRCGMLAGKQVIPAPEMEMKLKAALDARRDGDLVIVARTDARAVEGLDAAIGRAERYARTGADAIFLEGPRTRGEAEEIARRIDSALLYNVTPPGSVPPLDVKTLEQIGFKFLSFSIYILLAAIPAMQGFLRQLKREGDVAKAGRNAAGMQEYLDILGYEAWRRYEDMYAVPAQGSGRPAKVKTTTQEGRRKR
jgi:2-methylisocitrate lyase-like PEP mutase family enzyme